MNTDPKKITPLPLRKTALNAMAAMARTRGGAPALLHNPEAETLAAVDAQGAVVTLSLDPQDPTEGLAAPVVRTGSPAITIPGRRGGTITIDPGRLADDIDAQAATIQAPAKAPAFELDAGRLLRLVQTIAAFGPRVRLAPRWYIPDMPKCPAIAVHAVDPRGPSAYGLLTGAFEPDRHLHPAAHETPIVTREILRPGQYHLTERHVQALARCTHDGETHRPIHALAYDPETATHYATDGRSAVFVPGTRFLRQDERPRGEDTPYIFRGFDAVHGPDPEDRYPFGMLHKTFRYAAQVAAQPQNDPNPYVVEVDAPSLVRALKVATALARTSDTPGGGIDPAYVRVIVAPPAPFAETQAPAGLVIESVDLARGFLAKVPASR